MNWKEYTLWTHETAVRRVDGQSDPREKAELMEIWGLGLGGELLEVIAAMSSRDAVPFSGLPFSGGVEIGPGTEVIEHGPEVPEESGDAIYYLARLYVDTGNEADAQDMAYLAELHKEPMGLPEVARHVGRVVETIKKALRKEGRAGLNRLCRSKDDRSSPFAQEGRREEFGGLLNLALHALTSWFERHGMTLEQVIDANVKKLTARKAAGTIAVQGERKTS